MKRFSAITAAVLLLTLLPNSAGAHPPQLSGTTSEECQAFNNAGHGDWNVYESPEYLALDADYFAKQDLRIAGHDAIDREFDLLRSELPHLVAGVFAQAYELGVFRTADPAALAEHAMSLYHRELVKLEQWRREESSAVSRVFNEFMDTVYNPGYEVVKANFNKHWGQHNDFGYNQCTSLPSSELCNDLLAHIAYVEAEGSEPDLDFFKDVWVDRGCLSWREWTYD